MSVVRCCVAATLVLGLLLCLVGDAHSSVCCSLPTAVRVPCEHRSDAAAAATLAEDSSSDSSEPRSTSDVLDDAPAAEPAITVAVGPDIMAADPSSDDGADQSSDEATPPPSSDRVCHEYYCGTVLVEAADTYCSYEPCDPAGCHCAADCIDGSYRTPKWLR